MSKPFFAAVVIFVAAAWVAVCGKSKPDNVQAEPIIVTYPEASPDAAPVPASVSIADAAPASCKCIECKCEPCKCGDWQPGTWQVCESSSCRMVTGQRCTFLGNEWGYSDCGRMYRITDGTGTLHAAGQASKPRQGSAIQRTTGGSCSSGSCGSGVSRRGLFGRR